MDFLELTLYYGRRKAAFLYDEIINIREVEMNTLIVPDVIDPSYSVNEVEQEEWELRTSSQPNYTFYGSTRRAPQPTLANTLLATSLTTSHGKEFVVIETYSKVMLMIKKFAEKEKANKSIRW